MSDRRYSVRFYLRSEVEGGYHYERLLDPQTPDSGWLELDDPPAVGDIWWVGAHGLKIIERQFMPSTWGSVNWPYGERHQLTPITVDLVGVETDGVFRDEVPDPDDEEA